MLWSVNTIGLFLIMLGAGIILNSPGVGATEAVDGYAPLLGLVGVLAGVLMSSPSRAVCSRRNLAVVGIVLASSAVAAAAGAGDQVLSFTAFMLMLVAVALISVGFLDA